MLCNLAVKRLFWWAQDPSSHGKRTDLHQSKSTHEFGEEFFLRQSDAKSGWWRVVETMANLVAEGCHEADLTEMGVRQALLARGFPEDDITKACAWIERSTASGSLQETWAMLQPHGVQPRLSNPLERAFFSDDLWHRLELARQRALIPPDLFEKLLEGVRVLDLRGLDDLDIENIMAEMMRAAIPQVSPQTFRTLLQRQHPMLLC